METSDKGKIHQLHAYVSGRVQGVGFRWFVIRHARNLELKGWVQNLYDGRVELIAEGKKDKLELLICQLNQGPQVSFVHKVESYWQEAEGKFQGFDARY